MVSPRSGIRVLSRPTASSRKTVAARGEKTARRLGNIDLDPDGDATTGHPSWRSVIRLKKEIGTKFQIPYLWGGATPRAPAWPIMRNATQSRLNVRLARTRADHQPGCLPAPASRDAGEPACNAPRRNRQAGSPCNMQVVRRTVRPVALRMKARSNWHTSAWARARP